MQFPTAKVTAMLGAFVATCLISVQSSSLIQQQEDDEKIEIPSEGPDAIARKDFMRTKLMYSQNIFEGLTTGRFPLIEEGLNEIKNITHAEQWVTVDDERYQKLTDDFNMTLTRMAQALDSKNIDAVALRYYQMSTSCIDCHQHISLEGYKF